MTFKKSNADRMKAIKVLLKIIVVFFFFLPMVEPLHSIAMAPPATSVCIVVPEFCGPSPLDGSLTVLSTLAYTGTPVALQAKVTSEASSDTINYTFFCDQNTDSLSTSGFKHKKDAVIATEYIFGSFKDSNNIEKGNGEGCVYSRPGTYYPKVIIERGSSVIEKRVSLEVYASSLGLEIQVNPYKVSTNAPSKVTANVTGNAKGPYTYTVYCNSVDASTTKPVGVTPITSTSTSKTFETTCSYPQAGIYYPKVIVENNFSQPVAARKSIEVNAVLVDNPGGGNADTDTDSAGNGDSFPFGVGSGGF